MAKKNTLKCNGEKECVRVYCVELMNGKVIDITGDDTEYCEGTFSILKKNKKVFTTESKNLHFVYLRDSISNTVKSD